MNTKERNSSLELLRIMCIIGIVIMHTNGSIMSDCTGVNMLWCQLENGIFQAGVSVFVLISGYFGIPSSVKRVVKLELDILFYSVISGVISYICFGSSLLDLLKCFLPISTNKYWFLSCYMILMLFAPFINKAVENIQEQEFKKLLLALFAVFYVLPTIVYYDVIQQNGKSVVHMLCLYLLGRYMRKYGREKYPTKYLLLCLGTAYVISVSINVLSSYITGGNGAHIPMSRDCSIFIVVEAVCIFLIFKNHPFYSKTINSIAKHVVAVYMFEGVVRALLVTYVFDWNVYNETSFWCVISVMVACISFICCVLIDAIKGRTIDKLRDSVEDIIRKNLDR